MKLKPLACLIAAITMITFATQAQVINCGTGRYINYVFSTFSTTTVTYSTANSTSLLMDIYQPTGDTMSRRPVIILAHGGSFIGGDRASDSTVIQLCRAYARRGYVTVSIDYRLASNVLQLTDSNNTYNEIAKAIGDAKAAVRYLRQSFVSGNTYRIDTSRIYGGGNSVGAAIFLQIAYVNTLSEYSAGMQTAVNSNGGIDGNSGNAGYSSRIAGVINLAGAVLRTSSINAGEIPSFNAQGDADAVIPYNCGLPFNGLCPVTVCGLGSMEPVYNSAGIAHESLVFPGAAHVPWQTDTNIYNKVDTSLRSWLFNYSCAGFVYSPIATLAAGQSVCPGTVVHPALTVSGGTLPYTYSWSATGSSLSCNNCTTPSATITQASTYTVTVTDAAHLTGTATVNYTVTAPVSITLQANGPTSFCSGGSVTLSTALSYSSYQWSSTSTAASITATQQGTYSLTATAATGCQSTGSITVNVIAPPATQSIVGNPSIIPFQAYTYAVNNVNGITYRWSATGGAVQSGQSTNSVSILWAGSGPYAVTLIQTNGSGCSDTARLTVTATGSGCTLTASLTATAPATVCAGDTIILVASASAASTYQWLKNNAIISGATDDTLIVTTSGSYQVQATAGSCVALSTANSYTFLSLPAAPSITLHGGANSCLASSVSLGAGAGYTSYHWNTNATTDSITVSVSGIYMVTVTGANGCKAASAPYQLNLSIVQPYQICLVSVDSSTGHNIVVWNKPSKTGVDSFFIYKETNQFNVFGKIGAIGVNDLSVYEDANSNPQQQADRYKIAVLDTCGNVTLESDPHKTIHLTINSGISGSWNLIWSGYEGFSFPTYNIYRGTATGGLQFLASISSGNTSYTDVTPPANVVYYQVEAVNPGGCSPSRAYSSTLSNIVREGNVGIHDIDAGSMMLYPNPNKGTFTLQAMGQKNVSYTITDVLGHVVMRQSIISDQQQIDMAAAAAGVYTITVEGARPLRFVVAK